MAVIGNTSYKNASFEIDIKSMLFFFNYYYISFKDMKSFFEFLVSVINHYHINGLQLFWDIFEWFCLQISSDAKYFFPLLSNTLWSRINSCYSILFSNLKQIEHNIIISRVISSHMGPISIETPYISSHMGPISIETPNISSHMGHISIETPYISSHMGPIYIETPYISSHMGPISIKTPYISSHMVSISIETPYISSHMGPISIETPYISSHMVSISIETPYISSHMGHISIETSY